MTEPEQQSESGAARPRRIWRALGVLAVLAIGGTGGWLVYEGRLPELEEAQATTPAEPAKPISVTVTPARIEQMTDQLLVSGTLGARHEVLVGPEIDGLRVTELLVEEGDSVEKGAVLARLDASNIDILLAQNEASLAKADATIAQAKASIAEAEATEVDAKAAYERAKSLHQGGNSTLESLMAREMAARVANARVTSARQALTLAEADKALVGAQRRELQLRRARAEIKATEAGIVSERKIRLGAIVSAGGEPLFRIVRDGVIELAAEVPETALSKVRPGQPASILPAGMEQPIVGTVRLVSGAVDATSRLGRAWITLPANPALRPGIFARGTIELAARRGVTVPQSAVLFDDAGAHLQIVDDLGNVETRDIKTGIKADGRVEVVQGVAEGESVVARAGGFLRSGDRVTPVPESQVEPSS